MFPHAVIVYTVTIVALVLTIIFGIDVDLTTVPDIVP